ncbi:MAG: hypothetical protein LBL74_05370 [Bacteroidales bacterium]|nr:hypothetical protein [Bacteroidales bacterium]
MNEFNLGESIRFILKYWKVLAIVFVCSAIVTGCITFFFPNLYKSQVTLLSADSNSISKGILSNMDVADPLNFGTEKEVEHTLELLTSGKIMSDVISKFDLKNHYGIKAEGEDLNDRLGRKLYNRIKVKRTENLGIKIMVWDTDPKYAADMANYIVERLTALRTSMKKAKMDSICVAIEKSKSAFENNIKILSDSVSLLSKQYGIFDPDIEIERWAQEMAKQVAAGNTAAIARLEKRYENFQNGGMQIANLRLQIEYKQISLRVWNEQLEKAKIDANANIPTEFVSEYAYPEYFKDKPKRTLITLFAALCCTLLSIGILVIRDKVKAIKAQ